MKALLNKYLSFFCLILFSFQVLFSFVSSQGNDLESKLTWTISHLMPSSDSQNDSDTEKNSHDPDENEESEENEEGKELELLSGASDPSKYHQLQDSPEYFYLLKSSEGILEEQFSPPECRV
jgi:hypothetical protein